MPDTTPDRGALRVLQSGAIAIVMAAATYKLFELDRYFVPKELALHLTALALIIASLQGARRLDLTRVETLFGVFLLLGIFSAALATNHWAAARAVGITFSGLVILCAARATSEAGSRWPLLAALVAAIVLASVMSLLQAYGITSDYFSLNRSPGGTFGNRNFVAHLAAIGAPALLLLLLLAPRARDPRLEHRPRHSRGGARALAQSSRDARRDRRRARSRTRRLGGAASLARPPDRAPLSTRRRFRSSRRSRGHPRSQLAQLEE